MSTLSDDDYDFISNPGDIDTCHTSDSSNLIVSEPPPCDSSSRKIPATQWSAAEIQEYVSRAVGQRAAFIEDRVVRVYVDGSFDPLTASHALQLRQAKLSFIQVYLLVGVFSDQTIKEHEHDEPMTPQEERYELVRHCRWVDKIIEDAPWKLDERFLHNHHIDFVAIEEGASVNPAYHQARVLGYDEIKHLGKAIPTRRIVGTQQPLSCRGISPTNSSTVSPSTPRAPTPPEDFIGNFNPACAL